MSNKGNFYTFIPQEIWYAYFQGRVVLYFVKAVLYFVETVIILLPAYRKSQPLPVSEKLGARWLFQSTS